ncbi:hypothetical protein M9Y10_044419 [Tritrichomonas musculus]|uniref:Uncharacterized protein n=1 Tax=Tritrichomonas musculus TaxID=1915356 RepID=A0ABR2JSK1_9EUKA
MLNTLRNLLRTKTIEEFKTCVAVPLDQDRYFATLEDIEDNLKLSKEEVEDVPSNFVFNIDEVGHSEYADSYQKIVIVPKACQSKTVPYPLQKKSKHASCIVCISPVGIVCLSFFYCSKSNS